MSYDENRISDLIDKGLHEQEQLFLSSVSGSLPISDKEYSKVMKAIYPKDNSKKFSRQ